MISQDDLKALLSYDAETGEFRWRQSTRPGWVGKSAGTKTNGGYIRIALPDAAYVAHRLAWLYVHGTFPESELDHINGIRHDNRIKNLRAATRPENMQNKRRYKTNSSGMTGVSWVRHMRKWVALIQVNGKRRYIGFYESKEDASAAYLEAKSSLHTFQPSLPQNSENRPCYPQKCKNPRLAGSGG